jgi:hypothetical protein
LGNFVVSIKEEDEATLKNLYKDQAQLRMAGNNAGNLAAFQQLAAGKAMMSAGEGMARGGGGGDNPMVVLANPASSEVQQTFAAIRRQIAGQILKEQGINVESLGLSSSSGQAVGGSTAMRYLMQQMLMSPQWTMTPDEWAANEATARVTIQTFLAGLLTTLTAAPEEEPEAPQGQTATTSKRGARK